MTSDKYIGMDVHKEAISIAVMNSAGKLLMECIIETKAITILQFFGGLRGALHVTFERRDLGGVAIRSAQSARERDCSLQPTEKCAVERREQERPDRCSKISRLIAR
jgi:hypothetical protein